MLQFDQAHRDYEQELDLLDHMLAEVTWIQEIWTKAAHFIKHAQEWQQKT